MNEKETAAPFADLRRFFAPRRVAFVGATEDLRKFGGRCVRLLIDFGYEGDIYPVNPGRTTIFGRACYPSIEAVPETPDHVGIVLPAAAVPEALQQCARRGVPFVTVFSSGFAETGTDEGRALQQRALAIARAGGIRFMGPNCNGLINFVDRFALTSTASIRGPRRPAGDIAVASQSGGAGQINVMWRAQQAGLDVSYQVSCGNDADLDLLDYMAFMVEDPRTRVVLAIAERLADGHRLRALASRAAELDKPLVMVKVGRSDAGSRVAASHTGSLTGSDAVFDAAFEQLGIVRVDDCNELYEVAMLLRRGRRPRGRRAAAASVSGGNLVMLADLGATLGIHWPRYSQSTQSRLAALLPGYSVATNPTDLTAAAIGRTDTFAAVAREIAGDESVDVVVPVITLSPAEEIRSLARFAEDSEKPVAILWTGAAIDDASLTPEVLVAGGHAVYRDTLPCLKAMRSAMRYGEFRGRRDRVPAARPDGIDRAAAAALLAGVQGTLSEHRAKRLLACYGLAVTRETTARTADEAAAFASLLARPVALKIQSPDIPHKTEARAIRLGVAGDEAVRSAYGDVVESARAYRPDARIEGVLVQEMVDGGTEVLVGVSRDPTFGPVVTVGLGGIYVEVLKDVVFRLPPIDADAALAMLRQLRAWPLLAGARGRAPADTAALARGIERLSWLAVDFADVLTELDVNPLTVLSEGEGTLVVDALVVARQPAGAAPPGA